MEIQQTLINACIKKERRAEYELYKTCYSYLMSICIRYTRNPEKAKEVLNLGFYKIISNLEKFDASIPFKPWARKIMINTLINEFKKEKRHYENVQYVENYFESEDFANMNAAITKIDAEQLYAFIAKLPPATQQVFNMYFIDGFKHKEISEELGISEGTSKWHLNSAKEKLKEMLEKVNEVINVNEHE